MSDPKESAGADLVIPALALAFATYFFVSINELAWEAKANGVIIGTLLVLLVLAQVARIGYRVAKGRADLSTRTLWAPRDALPKRIGMVLVTIAFIATLKWLGLTLGLLAWMVVALWVMGVRNPRVIAAISVVTAASAYLLFIAALNSSFPHGPIERLLSARPGSDPAPAAEKRGLTPGPR